MGRLLHLAVLGLMLAVSTVFALFLLDAQRSLKVRELTHQEFRRVLEYGALEADPERPVRLYSHCVRGRYREPSGRILSFRAIIPAQRRAEIGRQLAGKRIPVEPRGHQGWLGAVAGEPR